jgi:predicted RNA-binding protein
MEAAKEMDNALEAIRDSDIRTKYAALFGVGVGRDVLADILITCHFGTTLDYDNKAQIAEFNVGMVIAGKAGVLKQIDSQILGLKIKNKEEV